MSDDTHAVPPVSVVPSVAARPVLDLQAERAWNLRHVDPAASVALAEGRRHEALQAGDELAAARAELSLAWARYRAGDLTGMLRLAGHAVTALSAHRDLWLARGYLVLGNATAGIGERDHAAQMFGRAMEIAWALEDVSLVATAMHDNALHLEDDVAAVEALRRSEQLFREVLDGEAQCFAAFNIAERLLKGGDKTAAVRAANRAAHVAKLTGLLDLELTARLTEARANADLGHLDRADLLVRRVLERAHATTPDTRPFLEVEAADLLVRVGDPRAAGAVAARLLAEYETTHFGPRLHRVLAEGAAAAGRPEDAYRHLQLVIEAEESLDDERAHALAAARAGLRAAQRAEAQAEAARRRARDLAENMSCLPGGADVRELNRADPVTGLRTRPFLIAELERLGRELDPPLPLTVVLLDIDGLEELNRAFGRDTGDDVLALVSHILRVTVRGSDLVCRFGDDEIALLVPDLGPDHAGGYAERLLAAAVRTCKEAGVTVTLSGGVATTTRRSGIHGLLARADLALYHAKADGGDGVRTAPSQPEDATSIGLDLAQ